MDNKITNEQILEQAQQDPVDVAARIYGSLIPQLDSRLGYLSKKGLQRVLIATMKSGLEDFNFKLSKQENDAAILLKKILDSKYVMIMHVLDQHMKDAANIAETEEKKESENVSSNN